MKTNKHQKIEALARALAFCKPISESLLVALLDRVIS